MSAPPAPSQDSLQQIGKRVGAQLQPRFPGDGAIFLCSFIFQGQTVFASPTFTADVVLHAGLSLAVLFPLFPFILSLPHLCAAHHVHHSGRETTGSLSRCSFQKAKETSFPQLSPPLWENTAVGALSTDSKYSFNGDHH